MFKLTKNTFIHEFKDGSGAVLFSTQTGETLGLAIDGQTLLHDNAKVSKELKQLRQSLLARALIEVANE